MTEKTMTTEEIPDLVPVPKDMMDGLIRCAIFAAEIIDNAQGGPTDPASSFILSAAERNGLRHSRPITDDELNDANFLRQMCGIDGTATVKANSAAFMAVLEAITPDAEEPAGEQEAAE